ncbi:MAG: prepilin-type N-terminal cleavage/methylation domain-containing protein [Candidatus Kaiserbacteria bacterium]|nr:prepilin-type N-terminal cleavage/methylation domain-containing protein [Candidatus Kaiserbacteria bacterium]MCB9816233.1 prepilin-type N-terminal cleavage/methylation domain-containing protein [Candidatus Nomurabacteria bacterium]
MNRSSLGFTLPEMLVVVAVITILSSLLYYNFNDASVQSRNAQRQADLRALQSAIEQYKLDKGMYPPGCNGALVWSGEIGTIYDCPSADDGQYIVGLAPEYIRALPTDPKRNGNNSGYIYVTNAARSAYKIMAARTAELTPPGIQKPNAFYPDPHPFMSCDVSDNNPDAVCNAVSPFGGLGVIKCDNTDSEFRYSYGLWGGYPDEPRPLNAVRYEEELEKVICRMP